MHTTFVRRSGALVVGLTLLATACGSDKKETAATTPPTAAPTTAAAGTETTAAGGTETTAAGGGDSGAIAPMPTGVKCENTSLAFLGALSGDNGNLGKNMVDGAQLAIDQFNAANPDCQVKFETSDSQGDPVQATPLADTIISNKAVIGLIGPGFSGETKAVMPKLEAATLPMVTPGATNAALSTNGWKMFHRVLANDDKQAPGVANLIKGVIKGTKVAVIDDGTEYGKGLADSVRKELGALDVKDAGIDPKAADYSAAITAVTGAGADVVFYGGYYAEAAKLITQMRDSGYKGTFVSGDGSLDPGFVENAGAAGEGTYLTATGAPPDVNPTFQKQFNEKYGNDPRLYSPESYDCARIFLAGIAAGKTDRASMAEFVSAYDAPGVTKTLKFDATGEPEGSAVFYTLVDGGKLVSKGLIPS